MPFSHGLQTVIWIDDSTGTCRNLSGDFNSVTMSWTKDNPDTTTFGKTTTQRISGLRDMNLNGAGIWNTGAASADDVLGGLMAASINTLVRYAPGGSVSGCPLYSACMQLASYEISGPIAGPVGISWAFQHASGSVTDGTV